MRTSLAIFVIAALCVGQDVLAQAKPKEVVVVDGQVAVSNLPESQTVDGTVAVSNLPESQTVNGTVSVDNLPAVQDVWLLGATNPIPVAVTATPNGEMLAGRKVSDTGVASSHLVVVNPPPGKLIRPTYLGIFLGGISDTADVRCFARIRIHGFSDPLIQHFFEMHYIGTRSEPGKHYPAGSVQFSDLPPASKVEVQCSILQDEPITLASIMELNYSGYLVDASTP